MSQISIAAILPVFNRVKETIECIKRLEQLNNNEVHITTILVDDGSTDGTENIVSATYPNVIILKGNGNLWWAGGVNKGLKYIKNNITEFDYILILNNDTFFNEKTLLPLLSVVRSNKKAVCASAVIDEESGKIYNAGQIRSGFFQDVKPLFKGENLSCHKDKIINCDTTGTRFVLMSTEIIEHVGFFDSKKFRHDFSDFEYFLRAKKKGYSIIINTNSVISTVQNKNYFNKLLVEQNILTILKSFFDIKYSINLKTVFYSSFAHKPFFIGFLGMFKNYLSLLRWVLLKFLLPPKKLSMLIETKWKI